MGLIAQALLEPDGLAPAGQPQAPNVAALMVLLVLLAVAILIGRRVARRFRRRERETSERALWAMSGYYPTTRVFRKWGYGHNRRRFR